VSASAFARGVFNIARVNAATRLFPRSVSGAWNGGVTIAVAGSSDSWRRGTMASGSMLAAC
jgi:hypothetical protein